MRALLLLALGAAVTVTDARAFDPFAGMVPMDDETLAEKRGRLNVGGYELDLGVRFELVGGEIGSTLPTDLLYEVRGERIVIENALDNVELGRTLVIDVVVSDLPALRLGDLPSARAPALPQLGGLPTF